MLPRCGCPFKLSQVFGDIMIEVKMGVDDDIVFHWIRVDGAVCSEFVQKPTPIVPIRAHK